jgi:branched-chain amino acid transport system permease protein
MLTLASALATSSNAAVILQQIENGITLGAMYALVALGYTLVYGIIELINFAHGDVFMWGTVICLFIANALHLSGTLNGFELIGAMLLLIVGSSAFCAVLNVVIERLAYRPLRRAPRLIPLIAAIGVSFVLENIARLIIGPGDILFPPIFPLGSFYIGPVQVLYLDVFIVVVALILMYGLYRFIQTTKLGRAMRATAQDPEAASLMGVNINRTIMLTFLIGGALAGAAGLFYNLKIHEVQYFAGYQLGLIAFTAAVLGGIGNIYGAVLGGFVIGLIEALATQLIPQNGFAYQDVVVFAILVLILVLRPSGLLGQQVPDKA